MGTLKLGSETGSFFNHLMSNSPALPNVKVGATKLHWTDRTAYFVLSVSEDKKQCKIQRAKAIRADKSGMSECQDYRYEKDPNNPVIELVYRYNNWYEKFEGVDYTKSFEKKLNQGLVSEEERKSCFGFDEDGYSFLKEVQGKTERKARYSKISIDFSGMNEYYDFSF